MIIEKIPKLIKDNVTVALVTVTKSSGSTPADVGKEMLVSPKGNIGGTIGGGQLELKTIALAKQSIERNKNMVISYDLKKDLGMECGGMVEMFVKVYSPLTKIVIIGGGHVGNAVYKLAKVMGYDTLVIDDRSDVLSNKHYPNEENLLTGNIDEITKNLDISPQSTYVVIATHGHREDEIALYNMILKKPKYIGLIGSTFKVENTINNLIKKGIDKKLLDQVYAPIGIALGGGQPNEIALSIMSEILLLKNEGELKHMRELK